MKEKIKNTLTKHYKIAKYEFTLIFTITKIQIKEFFDRIKPRKSLKNRKRKVQYKIPTIRIVGEVTKEEVEEIHDSFVAFIVDEYFKDYNCHAFKFKGETYVRLDEPKKKEYIDVNDLCKFNNRKYENTIADSLSRNNYSRYVNK